MKTVSLKIDESSSSETEKNLKLTKKFKKESALVQSDSLTILKEFEELGNSDLGL